MMPQVLYGVIGLQRIRSGAAIAFHDKHANLLRKLQDRQLHRSDVSLLKVASV
ncbi:hypothetical protein [Bradyrhizobium japonicum]|uniref:hypothetical protein n=1 Tax=Bradyrhizobium japonicum TaxID=375 RepID=UPI000A5DC4A0|nr:hypothetical protein [Bradyrhizobium japonicum]